MISRADLITIAVNAGAWANEGEIDSVLDVLEPIIRKDERAMAEMEEIGDILIKYQAKALRAAADAWQQGEWTAITAKVKAGSVIGAAQIMTDWIRDRAAQIEKDVP